MQKLREFAEFLKPFIPKAHNRLAAAMVYAGIALIIGPPLFERIMLWLLNKTIQTNLTVNDQLYGFGLVAWGSIYHIVMTKLTEISVTLQSQQKFEIRRSLIEECRIYLNTNEFDRRTFAETVTYSRVRPFLSPTLINLIESNPQKLTVVVGLIRGSGADNYKSQILDELVELEKKWCLL